ncbi:hypothetical protein DSO57_1019496 [Entomophthora muscae]|uniref:Uncharacterized protein n=1 Tax=Entomophthora muscae TaxID=34485 RepID=A0ACC2ST72_9FUNG|nr:hypothetical protein DSO57_1019496 [Entomophthora muscae]
MEGTQYQSTNTPVVRRGCGCPRGSKNRVSATQVPTQGGDGRGEFHSDAALTQLVQGAQAARVRSINPWVPKLNQKPNKVNTTKTVRNKEVELTSYMFDAVYHQELVPSAMMEKVNSVLNTTYEPYVSDGNQENSNEPKFYRTTEGKLVLKKVVAFYNKVLIPYVPVPEQDPSSIKLIIALLNVSAKHSLFMLRSIEQLLNCSIAHLFCAFAILCL